MTVEAMPSKRTPMFQGRLSTRMILLQQQTPVTEQAQLIRCSVQQQNKPTSFEAGTTKIGTIKKVTSIISNIRDSFMLCSIITSKERKKIYAMQLAKLEEYTKID